MPQQGPGLPGCLRAFPSRAFFSPLPYPYIFHTIGGLRRSGRRVVCRTESSEKRMSLKSIRIRGAREHNLKNLNVEIPRDQLVVITGLSGSRQIHARL